MIIWSGAGFVVVLVAGLFQFIAYSWNSQLYEHNRWPMVLAFWLSALAIFLLRPVLAGRDRVLRDVETGEAVKVNKEGSLFFIPTRYWPIILGLIGIIAAFVYSSTPSN